MTNLTKIIDWHLHQAGYQPSGVSKGVPPPDPKFSQFHAFCFKIVCCRPPRELAPLYPGKHGSILHPKHSEIQTLFDVQERACVSVAFTLDM